MNIVSLTITETIFTKVDLKLSELWLIFKYLKKDKFKCNIRGKELLKRCWHTIAKL